MSASIEPEAFGRVAAEAQAMERPVIATALGGSLETVEDGVTGWLCAPNDVTALADAIIRGLNQTPEERQQMGQRGRGRVMERFSKASMCALTLEVYRTAINQHAESP